MQPQGGNGSSMQTKAVLINERAVGTDQSRRFVYVVNAACVAPACSRTCR
jgi:multidrug efflux system membrane fusion protein